MNNTNKTVQPSGLASDRAIAISAYTQPTKVKLASFETDSDCAQYLGLLPA